MSAVKMYDCILYYTNTDISTEYRAKCKDSFPLCILYHQRKLHVLVVVVVQEFEEEALSWEDKLNRINGLFDVWIDVQRRWVYLEGIFTGSADIKHLLPIETSRFQR